MTGRNAEGSRHKECALADDMKAVHEAVFLGCLTVFRNHPIMVQAQAS